MVRRAGPLFLAGILVASAPATAAPLAPGLAGPPEPRQLMTCGRAPERAHVRAAAIFLGVGLAADIGSTAYGLHHSAHIEESNPVGPVVASSVAVAASVGAVWILDRKAHHPKAARIAAYVIGAAHLAYAANNVRVIRSW